MTPDPATPRLPLLLEPDELEVHLGSDDVLVVGLCEARIHFGHGHIPGAVHLD